MDMNSHGMLCIPLPRDQSRANGSLHQPRAQEREPFSFSLSDPSLSLSSQLYLSLKLSFSLPFSLPPPPRAQVQRSISTTLLNSPSLSSVSGKHGDAQKNPDDPKDTQHIFRPPQLLILMGLSVDCRERRRSWQLRRRSLSDIIDIL